MTDLISIAAQLLGTLGMICVVLAFNKTVNGEWDSQGERFNIVNLTGGVLLFISLCVHFNLGSFIIEIFWIMIAIKGLYRLRQKEHNFKYLTWLNKQKHVSTDDVNEQCETCERKDNCSIKNA